LPEGFKRAFGTGLLPMIALNLFIGYLGRGIIDNAAHLGGLVAGAGLALLIDYRRPGERSGVAVLWQVLRVTVLALVAVSFIQVARHFNDPPPTSLVALPIQVNKTPDNFVVFAKAMNDGQEAFYAAIQDGDSQNVTPAVQNLNNAPYLDDKAHELRESLRNLLLESLPVNPTATDAKTIAEAKQKKEKLIEQFEAWTKDYNEWLKTVRSKYGLVENTPNQ
jgi:hypothetical protein